MTAQHIWIVEGYANEGRWNVAAFTDKAVAEQYAEYMQETMQKAIQEWDGREDPDDPDEQEQQTLQAYSALPDRYFAEYVCGGDGLDNIASDDLVYEVSDDSIPLVTLSANGAAVAEASVEAEAL